MKMFKQMTKNKIYIIISTALLMFSVACTVIFYPYCAVRCYNALRDFIMSLGNYFSTLFDIEFPYSLSFLNLPDSSMSAHLPFDITEIERKLRVFFKAFVNIDNFKLFLYVSLKKINDISVIILLFLPVFLMLGIAIKPLIMRENKREYNEKTKALVFFEKYIEKYIKIVIFYVKDFFVFCNTKKWYKISFIFVWLVNLNLLPILFGALAYYYYFACEFKFLSVFNQIVRLLCDVLVAYQTACLPLWFAIGFYIFDKWRKKVAYDNLDHMEKMNRGFINARPLCSLVVGNTGKGKTTMAVSMAISTALMFRDKLLKIMQNKWLQFPNFPFINLENEIIRAMKYHEIFNLATCRNFAEKKTKRFLSNKTQKSLFDYNYEKFGLEYDSALRTEKLTDIIETYTKAYFMYIIESSLILANLSIREDDYIQYQGHFPIWDNDLFHRTNSQRDEYNHYAHILDFDILRLGQKIVEENKDDVFEFGVFVISEIGKERLNKVELQEVKKNAEEANQKNDLFNVSLKLDRHPSTIDFEPFIRFICDEQRPESLNADAREMCDIIEIAEKSDLTLVMPGFLFGDLAYDFIVSKFKGFFTEYRYWRSDNTLLMYLLRNAISRLFKYYKKIYDTFGAYELTLAVQGGRMEDEKQSAKYYIMCIKDYSDRFSTDCFSEYFYDKSEKMLYGVDDMSTYKGVKATFEELKQQNSYLVKSLLEADEVEN